MTPWEPRLPNPVVLVILALGAVGLLGLALEIADRVRG